MPLAPALRVALLTTSFVAAASIALYETNPQVRSFVDNTRDKAYAAMEDFIENLEAEFNPDAHTAMRRRQRRRQAWGARGGPGRQRDGGEDVLVRLGDTSQGSATAAAVNVREGQELRQRHAPVTGDSGGSANEAASIRSEQTHSTLFEQAAMPTHQLSSATPDLDGLSLLPDEYDAASYVTSSVDDNDTLDPFADPLSPFPTSSYHDLGAVTVTGALPAPLSSHPVSVSSSQSRTPLRLNLSTEALEESRVHVQLTPTTGATSLSPRILTPMTSRTGTTGVDDEPLDYFENVGEGESEEVMSVYSAEGRGTGRRQSRTSEASSGVGFETPDEDEDDEDWGRTR